MKIQVLRDISKPVDGWSRLLFYFIFCIIDGLLQRVSPFVKVLALLSVMLIFLRVHVEDSSSPTRRRSNASAGSTSTGPARQDGGGVPTSDRSLHHFHLHLFHSHVHYTAPPRPTRLLRDPTERLEHRRQFVHGPRGDRRWIRPSSNGCHQARPFPLSFV